MKKLLVVLAGLLSIVGLMAFVGGVTDVHSNSGAPAGTAGDPAGGSKTCNTTNCHTGATVGNLSGVISSNIPAAGYTAGGTYTITANFVRPGHTKFGFEATPQNSSGTKLGTMTAQAGTQLVTGSSGKYITHTIGGVSGSGSKTWNFTWTAPATGLGPVTFYGAFNATNNNNQRTGDSIFTSALVVTENTTAVHNSETRSLSFSAFPNPTHDNLNIAFTLKEPASVEIEIFDIHGNKAEKLLTEKNLSGDISENFDLVSYPTGVYFLRFTVNGMQTVQKVIKL